MQETTSATASQSTTTSATSNTTSSVQEATDEQYNTFLRLLTAQVQNQDPLAPLDSTQFVEQLATFSSLEQQVRTNQLLESISLLIAQNLNGESPTTSQTSIAAFDGQPINYDVSLPENTDLAVVEIKDVSGEIVFSTNVTADSSLSWDGKLSSGELAPQGLYALSASYYKDGTLISSGPVTLNNEASSAAAAAKANLLKLLADSSASGQA